MEISNGIISNCDEMLEFLVRNYETPYVGELIFQGDKVWVDGYMPDVYTGTMVVVSPKFDGVVFLIGEKQTSDGMFLLSIIKGHAILDQMPGVYLPMYVREELIATARGLW